MNDFRFLKPTASFISLKFVFTSVCVYQIRMVVSRLKCILLLCFHIKPCKDAQTLYSLIRRMGWEAIKEVLEPNLEDGVEMAVGYCGPYSYNVDTPSQRCAPTHMTDYNGTSWLYRTQLSIARNLIEQLIQARGSSTNLRSDYARPRSYLMIRKDSCVMTLGRISADSRKCKV